MFWPNLQLQFQKTNNPFFREIGFWQKRKCLDTRCYFGGGGTSLKTFDPLAGTGVRGLYQQLNQMLTPQIGQGITPYGGQTVAGISPLQQQGFGLATGLSPLVTGSQQYYQDVLGQQAAGGYPIQQLAGRTLESLMQPYDMGAEREFWQQGFVNPAMQTWREQVGPQIMEQYGTDGVGGSLGQALSRSGEDLMTNLGGQLANILYSGQQAQLGRQQAGVGQAMGLAQLPGQIMGQAGQIGGQGMDILSQLLGYGGQQRGIGQEQLTGQYQQWQQAQPWANPYLQNYLGAALSQPGKQMYGLQQEAGLGSQMLGGLGGLLGQEGGMESLFGNLGTLGGGLGSLASGAAGGLGGILGGAGGLASGGASALAALLALI